MIYRKIIFDFDGTLADSFPFFTEVFDTRDRELELARQRRARAGFRSLDAPRERRPEVLFERVSEIAAVVSPARQIVE